MKMLKRALKYVTRKRAKTLVLFFLLLVIGMLVLLGISVKKASDFSQDKLRKSLGGKFSIDINYSEENPYYHTEKVEGGQIMYSSEQMNMDMVEKVMKIQGVESCDASVDTLSVLENIKFFPGNIPLDEEFAHTMKIVGTYSTQTNKDFLSGDVELVEGKNIESKKGKHEIIISKDLAELNGLTIGDKVVINDTKGGTVETKIVGLFQPQKVEDIEEVVSSYDKIQNRIFADIQTVVDVEQSQYITGFTSIQVQVSDPEDMDNIVSKVKKIKDFKWDDYAFAINVNNETYEKAKNSLERVDQLTNIFLIVVFIVSLLILSLILNMWNKSRIHETGIYLAVGIGKMKIVMQYLLEVAFIGVFAFFIAYFPSNAISSQLGEYLLQQEIEEDTVSNQAGAVLGETVEIDDSIEKIEIEIGIIEVLEVYAVGMIVILLATGISTISIVRLQPKEILAKMS